MGSYLSVSDGCYAVIWDTNNPAGYANRLGSYKTRLEYEFIRAHFAPVPARILDIAGGSGRFATKLLRDGYDVTVNDIDAPSLCVLQDRCRDRKPRLLPGDFLDVHVPGQFNCALAIECLDRIPFEQSISRVHGLLRPGGIFVLTVLNAGSWRFLARRMLGRAPAVEYVMKTQEYCEAFDRSGFDVLSLRGFMWMPFTVTSNSPLVPLFANIERVLRFSLWHSQSPWLLMAVRRRG